MRTYNQEHNQDNVQQPTERRHFMALCMGGLASVTLPLAGCATSASSTAWPLKSAKVGDLNMHYAEQGKGPLVLLCHGFPETSMSWRHQIPVLAAAGYRVVAPDLRGYGATGGPMESSQYTMPTLVADLTGLMDALGEKTAVVVGHDFGAVLAWNATLLAPDRFKGVVGMSVPYGPRPPLPPTELFKRVVGNNFHYMLYFQTPGVAEAELEPDMARSLKAIYHTLSGDSVPERAQLQTRPAAKRFMDTMIEPKATPPWLSEADLQYNVDQFKRHGLTRPLNWYRSFDANWQQTKQLDGAVIKHPSLFIAGAADPVLAWSGRAIERFGVTLPGLKRKVIMPGAGHWIQQERVAEVNQELLSFLREVMPTNG